LINRVACVLRAIAVSCHLMSGYRAVSYDIITPVWLDSHVPCKVLGAQWSTSASVRVFFKFNLVALCNSYVNYMLRTGIKIK